MLDLNCDLEIWNERKDSLFVSNIAPGIRREMSTWCQMRAVRQETLTLVVHRMSPVWTAAWWRNPWHGVSLSLLEIAPFDMISKLQRYRTSKGGYVIGITRHWVAIWRSERAGSFAICAIYYPHGFESAIWRS